MSVGFTPGYVDVWEGDLTSPLTLKGQDKLTGEAVKLMNFCKLSQNLLNYVILFHLPSVCCTWPSQ